MPDKGTIDVAQQVRAHLESLRAAGVLLLPRPQKPLTTLRVATAPVPASPPVEVPTVDPAEARRRSIAERTRRPIRIRQWSKPGPRTLSPPSQ